MFSRGSRTSGRHARDDRARRGRSRPGGPLPEGGSLAEELNVSGELTVEGQPGESGQGAGTPAPPPGPTGPYDIAEAPEGVARVDLGGLKIPSVPGVEVRVQANQGGQVQQVFLVHGDSALQLGAFAAPRSESIWEEVREEIRRSLFDDGVAAEEVPGEYGVELRARVRTQQGLKDLRFVGVSGPRWLVRAVYQGPAAVDPAKAGPLAECLRGVVVDRGEEARPVKEPLPLRLSEEMAAQLARQAPDGSAAAGSAAAGSAAAGSAGSGASGAAGPNGATVAAAPPRRRPSPRPRREG